MPLSIAREPLPLAEDAEGVVRVGGTRVTLDTVLAAFNEGATAEEIAAQYPSIRLADVYAVIGYYLSRKNEVDVYLDRQNEQREAVRRENTERFDPRAVRDRLLARRTA
jgi:uncharacterized protein (DUF433 family)